MKAVLDIVSRHRAGERTGLYSVCSAHPLVLEAAIRHAHELGGLAVIEATSNQVNQDGGYTGMVPVAFRDLVLAIAARVGLAAERVVLGGDHLGPNCWQSLPAREAMAKARVLVRAYVLAGFRKIHLDCSMSCADDPVGLDDERIAARTAELCAVTEAAWREAGGEAPVYIVGSEVPVPGGAHEELTQLAVTTPGAALATLAAHRQAFERHGLTEAWSRVVGLVVQPGVEFDHDRVIDYEPAKARALSGCLATVPGLVFEAHSTDYQTPQSLGALVADHFAILKVGPALTFALREALWAIDRIDAEQHGSAGAPGLRETMLGVMAADPRHWRGYYAAAGAALALQQQYSLSDRIRYYWPAPAALAAVAGLSARFDASTPPMSLVSQYLPAAHAAIRAGTLSCSAAAIVMHHVRGVLGQYSDACGLGRE